MNLKMPSSPFFLFFIFAMFISILLSIIFAADGVATIGIQSLFIFVLIIQIVVNSVIIIVCSWVLYPLMSLISTGLFFIPNNTPDTILVLQADGINGFAILAQFYYDFLGELAILFEGLLSVSITYNSGQTPIEAVNIVVQSFEIIVTKVVKGLDPRIPKRE